MNLTTNLIEGPTRSWNLGIR